jgi:hypothetical protein
MADKSKSFTQTVEIVLKTSPDLLTPIIKTVVSEFKYEEGLAFWTIEETETATNNYRKILVVALEIIETSIASEDCIGIITLMSLPNDLTLFRIPPRDHWYIKTTPHTMNHLPLEEHVRNNDFYLFWNESSFNRVVERLFIEFQRLGFIDFKKEKPPIGFRLPLKE